MLTIFSFITFYPFCAAFSLYEHVLACSDPDDCEDDIKSLENVGFAMAETSARRLNLSPFAKTITALNKVSRTLQDERRRVKGMNELGLSRTQPVAGLNLPPTTLDTFQNLVASELPHFDPSAFTLGSDFPMNLEGEFRAQGFVRALENDFIGRNWQNSWWDLSGGVEEVMAEITDRYVCSLTSKTSYNRRADFDKVETCRCRPLHCQHPMTHNDRLARKCHEAA